MRLKSTVCLSAPILCDVDLKSKYYFADLQPFSIQPQSQNVSINATLRLQCVTGYSAPPPLAYWTQNGTPLQAGSQLSGMFGTALDGVATQTSMVLVLFVTSRSEEGVYACAAFNPLLNRTVFSSPATVFVSSNVQTS